MEEAHTFFTQNRKVPLKAMKVCQYFMLVVQSELITIFYPKTKKVPHQSNGLFMSYTGSAMVAAHITPNK